MFYVVIIWPVISSFLPLIYRGAACLLSPAEPQTQPGTQQELICLINACKKVLTTKKCGLSQSLTSILMTTLLSDPEQQNAYDRVVTVLLAKEAP